MTLEEKQAAIAAMDYNGQLRAILKDSQAKLGEGLDELARDGWISGRWANVACACYWAVSMRHRAKTRNMVPGYKGAKPYGLASER